MILKKNLGKLQSTSLKFEIIWILHFEAWQIRFYTLKFGLLAKLHPLLVLGVKWHVDLLMCIFFSICQINPKNDDVLEAPIMLFILSENDVILGGWFGKKKKIHINMSTCHLTTKLQGVKFKQPQSLGVYFAIHKKKIKK